ncbi:hydantoin utilization protein B, partial [Neorhizobium sp. SHOUNA12A]|nr:hydantoin utilization protein B [Neorhizobium sp. SHOUNA12A]
NPVERETWRVARDVARGHVSSEAAERDYGVVIRDGMVDEAETEKVRAARTAPTGHFHYGPEREGYEAQWTPEAYDLLTDLLQGLPIHWRFFTKTEIFRRMKGRVGAEGVAAAFADVRARFTNMPSPEARKEAAE